MLNLAMAKKGPNLAFQHLEVPIYSFCNAMFELQECLFSSNILSYISFSIEAEMSELLILVLFYNHRVGSIRLP